MTKACDATGSSPSKVGLCFGALHATEHDTLGRIPLGDEADGGVAEVAYTCGDGAGFGGLYCTGWMLRTHIGRTIIHDNSASRCELSSSTRCCRGYAHGATVLPRRASS